MQILLLRQEKSKFLTFIISVLRWETLKYSKHSMIEYSDNNKNLYSKNLISSLISCDEQFLLKQGLLKDQINTLKASHNQIKQNQLKTIVFIIIACMLSLSLIFEDNTIQFVIITTVISLVIKLYSTFQKEEINETSLNPNDSLENLATEINANPS
jgi:hypothetical protein